MEDKEGCGGPIAWRISGTSYLRRCSLETMWSMLHNHPYWLSEWRVDERGRKASEIRKMIWKMRRPDSWFRGHWVRRWTWKDPPEDAGGEGRCPGKCGEAWGPGWKCGWDVTNYLHPENSGHHGTWREVFHNAPWFRKGSRRWSVKCTEASPPLVLRTPSCVPPEPPGQFLHSGKQRV